MLLADREDPKTTGQAGIADREAFRQVRTKLRAELEEHITAGNLPSTWFICLSEYMDHGECDNSDDEVLSGHRTQTAARQNQDNVRYMTSKTTTAH